MNGIAVPHASVKAAIVSLVAAAILLFALLGTAAAASPVGKDGKIHACYRVKGKPKGSLRIVPATQKRCKRGERRVAWSVASANGSAGSNGQSGAGGQAGGTGQAGSSGVDGSSEVALKSQISSLTLKIEDLENILNGVTHGDLVGTLATLNGLDNTDLTGAVETVQGLDNADLTGAVEAVQGLTNTELTEAVDSLPVVDSLCTQSTSLTDQVNTIGTGVEGIGLGGLIPGGLTLKLPTIEPLDGFTC